MTVTTHPVYRCTPGPLHATLLAGTVPLFLGALLSDIAYYQTFQIQWSNLCAQHGRHPRGESPLLSWPQ
ncbi:hypothetical protein BV349_04778 [Pseudomonas syringae pv. actinidiae]|uniref:hypothetical protein n=1 Tax=Pseudomonas syringae TaxID=317 RepID=UPI000A25F6C2|nr:hypothetical protein [Pseudomonas syringae]OSN62478.1 hypothetical protein BV349_04778 [Pseudomonas syringae pv. actinidiae]OSN72259.1 hypothetical protein BV351_04737 [Pseudomonas syringae pv. actinidiae]